jgi:uncharacterized membrane protein YebE (DUF533 family)
VDIQKILGELMGTTQTGADRIRHTLGADGLSGNDNPLAGLFSDVKQSMGGIAGQSRDLLGGFGQSVKDGNPLAIGGLAALVGAIFGGGGGAVRGAVGGGALALLGSMAWSALKGREAPEAVSAETFDKEAPLGLRDPRDAEEQAQLETTGMLVLKAMINAAKADGDIDAEEKARILAKIDPSDAEAHEFLEHEMAKPIDTASIVSAVTAPAQAAQVYAASLLAIKVDTAAERTYLTTLARDLKLSPEVVRRLHEMTGVPVL